MELNSALLYILGGLAGLIMAATIVILIVIAIVLYIYFSPRDFR